MVDMFGRVRPETNLEKIKAMVCTSGFVWSQIGKMAYKQRATGGGGSSLGEETDEGKLFRVQVVGGGFITQAPHGAIAWGNTVTDAGSRRGWGRIYHICGVLTHNSEVGGLPNSRMSVNFPQRRSDAGTFHVQFFSRRSRCYRRGGICCPAATCA